MTRTLSGCSSETKSYPQLIVSKNMETSVMQPQEIEAFQKPSSLEEDLKPQMRSWPHPTDFIQ